MNWSKSFFLSALSIGIFALSAARAEAATIYQIDDLTETPKAFVNGIEIGGAFVGEIGFITIPLDRAPTANSLDVIALTEPNTDVVSDYVTLQLFKGENTAELRFFSDPLPATFPFPLPNPLPPPDVTFEETGDYQTVIKLTAPLVNQDVEIQVRSDFPEPASFVLFGLGAGMAGFAGFIRRRQFQQSRLPAAARG
jgi:hypothetical protein